MSLSGLLYHLFEVVLLIVGAGSLALVFARQTDWKREMKEYAKANHFALPGKELPDGIKLRRTNLHNLEIADVMQGTLRGTDMVVFTE